MASSSSKPKLVRDRHSAPAVESLDRRVLLSVTASFSLATGELTVVGDENGNTIVISRDAGFGILVNGGTVPIQGGPATITNTSEIIVLSGAGNDNVSIDETNGALPRSVMFGGEGDDVLTGGSADDSIIGDAGNDTVLMGAGNDTFVWNSGDGDDIVDGQFGTDDIVFNGDDASGTFDITDAGAPLHHVLFVRDGDDGIVDFTGVEFSHVNTFGGSDTVTVNDQTDTDLLLVNVDLNADPPGGDGQPDTVIVNGTDGDDSADVIAFDGAGGTRIRAVVSTFPGVNIVGAEPTNDFLILNGLGGNDTVDASALPANLINVVVDGGLDDDHITASPGNDIVIGGPGNDTILMGAGDDSFFWNSFDGSDMVEGQGGIDSMVFNGSGDAEQFELSANGPRLRLTRDLGNIAMDVNGVELVTVSALNGGGDNIILNDLSGTSVTALTFRLSGLQQQNADHVIINGTSGTDAIHVEGDFANGVTVTGLAVPLRVVATEGPVDGITINSLGGADAVDASNLSAGAVSLSINGGAGNDTLTASRGDDRIDGGTGTDTINVPETEPGSGAVNVVPSGGDDTIKVNVDGTGAARVSFIATQRIGALNIGNSGRANVTASGTKVLTVTSLDLEAAGTLDLNDNDLIVDYSGSRSPALDQIQSLINSARAGGAWTGNGLTSTSAKNNPQHNTTLGAMEAIDYKSVYGPTAQFGGQSIDNTAVLVKYTYYGDTDFNGKVDGADYARIDITLNQEASTHADIGGWLNGDLDGNGKVDGADYALIDAAFNSQGAPLRPAAGSPAMPPMGKRRLSQL